MALTDAEGQEDDGGWGQITPELIEACKDFISKVVVDGDTRRPNVSPGIDDDPSLHLWWIDEGVVALMYIDRVYLTSKHAKVEQPFDAEKFLANPSKDPVAELQTLLCQARDKLASKLCKNTV